MGTPWRVLVWEIILHRGFVLRDFLCIANNEAYYPNGEGLLIKRLHSTL